jgi:hypothetical protein
MRIGDSKMSIRQPTFWALTTRHCRYLAVALQGSVSIDCANFLTSLEKRARLQGEGTDLEPSVVWFDHSDEIAVNGLAKPLWYESKERDRQ